MTDSTAPVAALGTVCLLVGLLWPVVTGLGWAISLVPLWVALYGTGAWLALATVLVSATRPSERTSRTGSAAVGVVLSGLLWALVTALGWWVGYSPIPVVFGLLAVVVGVAVFTVVDPGDGPALDDWERGDR